MITLLYGSVELLRIGIYLHSKGLSKFFPKFFGGKFDWREKKYEKTEKKVKSLVHLQGGKNNKASIYQNK